MVGLERVRSFWESHVNNEYFTRSRRGSSEYFAEIEARRYRSHDHLQPLFDRIASVADRGRLLEVGCGIGIDTLQLARRGFSEVVGVDLTEVAIELARERTEREGIEGVRFQVDNAESLSFDDGSFDAVYSFGVLHHTPRIEQAVAEVHRVLAPGGTAFVMLYHSRSLVNLVHRALRLPFESPKNLGDHCPVVYRFSVARVRRLFGDFDSVEIHCAYPFTYGMRFVRRLVPGPIERWLGRRIGWHLMIEARKAGP